MAVKNKELKINQRTALQFHLPAWKFNGGMKQMHEELTIVPNQEYFNFKDIFLNVCNLYSERKLQNLIEKGCGIFECL